MSSWSYVRVNCDVFNAVFYDVLCSNGTSNKA